MQQIEARARTLPVIAAAVRGRGRAELCARLETLGIPFSPIAKPGDMYADPHVTRPGGLVSSRMWTGETFRAPALPFEVDGAMMDAAGDVPGPGEDTDAVLSALGFSAAEIAAARGDAA